MLRRASTIAASFFALISLTGGAGAATCSGVGCTPGILYSGNDQFFNDIGLNGSLSLAKTVDNSTTQFVDGTAPGNYADDFVVTANAGGTSGTWTYTPDPGQLLVNYLLVKAGKGFIIYLVTSPLIDGSQTGTWSTAGLVNWKGKLKGFSHLSWYDTAPPAVPLPGAFLLMGTVLVGGLGFCKARSWRKSKAA